MSVFKEAQKGNLHKNEEIHWPHCNYIKICYTKEKKY